MFKPGLKSYGLLLVTAAVYSTIYLGINWYSFTYQTQNKLFWDWELSIPFIDWFILFYFSAYLSFIPVFVSLKFEDHLKISKALIFSGVFGGAIFLIYPTTCGFERNILKVENFKLLYSFLWGQDNPVTLMPSFHVGMSALFLIPLIKRSKSVVQKVIYLFWLMLICLSIVFVHQHHIIDIPTGLALAMISLLIFDRGRIDE